ncbi:hypothetical protein FKG94_19920 [Exilibacterium tricleocarpae]|uniref:DUF1269 domain-containing protein n=1 Tax=Exilibacterium tricleocarpae TaxID=2591008 RepID=A0A545T1R0_9GAMM|nr:hypothetical protein [Exilibacterium tricleocarpae]TQV71157.1 hypothetical protein FKG94_19920 [Exilibacterium tricleocarpae]
MSKQVLGLYKEYSAAALAVDKLSNQAGVLRDDISVIVNETSKGKHFDIEVNTKAPEGASAGAAVGGTLGAIAAGLTAVGAVAAPGIGLVAAGPILAALAGAGAGGAVGGLAGGLIGAGLSENEAKVVSDEVDSGNILIMVDAHDNHVDLVKEIFENTGAKSIH